VRGPEVRTQTLRTRISDGPARTMTEMTRIGGTLRDAAGDPVPNAWVAVPEAGRWAVTDGAGRYRFDRIQPGPHHVIARTAEGDETEATIEVPGAPADLVMGSGGSAGAKGRATRKK
jgi:protocatechuate 3,4-dioxygenase beta subunit